jgi:Fe2+ or Zn2+ uptake regulation protein
MQLEKALKFIKDNGHSITKPRKKILELMAQKSTPLTGPQIYRKIKKDIDESTMYRNLQFLEKIGLVSCLRLDKRGSHYAPAMPADFVK